MLILTLEDYWRHDILYIAKEKIRHLSGNTKQPNSDISATSMSINERTRHPKHQDPVKIIP